MNANAEVDKVARRSWWIRGLIVFGAVLVLGSLNYAIVGKQRVIRDGEVVFLRLAPVDPRSLMQGDYMALRFALAQELQSTLSEPASGDARGREGPGSEGRGTESRGTESRGSEGRGVEGRGDGNEGRIREGAIRKATVDMDERRIASLSRPASSAGPLAPPSPTRIDLRYRIRNGQVWLGTNAFFFEEGQADRFSNARYGEFRVDHDTGEAILVGLRNEALEPL